MSREEGFYYEPLRNGEETYYHLAEFLRYEHAVVFGWSSDDDVHLDMLMAYQPAELGNLGRWMNGETDLFVGVTGVGMFGFTLNGIYKHPTYVGNKFGISVDTTTVQLAELINGVCRNLEEVHGPAK